MNSFLLSIFKITIREWRQSISGVQGLPLVIEGVFKFGRTEEYRKKWFTVFWFLYPYNGNLYNYYQK
jgi:hypothetical protein